MDEARLLDTTPIERQYVVAEIALILALGEETVRVKLRAGHIKGRNVDGIWRIPKSEVTRYLAEGNIKPEVDK